MVIWGTLGFFVLKTDMNTVDIAFFRCLIGALVLGPYCWYRGMFTHRPTLSSLGLILLGGICIAFNWVLLFLSFRYASITLGNVSYYVQPIFLLLLGYFIFRERIESIKWGFILLSILGVYLTIDLTHETLSTESTQLLGVGCALAAGFLYSLATMIVKKENSLSAPLIAFIQFIGGGLVLLPMTSLHSVPTDLPTLCNLAIICFVHTVVAFVLYYKSVSLLSTDVIAIISYVDPIVAIITDVIFFNRHLSKLQIVGIILTLAGSYGVIQYQKFASIQLRILNKQTE